LFEFLNPTNNTLVASKSDVRNNYWTSKPVLLYNLFSYNKEKLLGKFRGCNQYHLYINMDVIEKIHLDFSKEQQSNLWRDTFASIFQFTKYFHSYWNQHIVSNRTCGIHLRFVSLLGDFKEIINNELPDAEKDVLVKKCIQVIITIIAAGDFEKYIVVADSSHFLIRLQNSVNETQYAPRLFIPKDGPIGHIDIDHSNAVLQKTILDFYLLSRCQKIYQVKDRQMYNSQFCKYASILGNAEYIIERI
jgi:hypothetical protein